ncbi:MAG: hypothetical protein R3300_16845 [Candidatus Promineifilaceae bacterium]|nr:hypothetical protein [Candidatus Promineifilaceae bacterium]
MEKVGQHFRLGVWTVQAEHRAQFIEAWQTSTSWLSERLPNERGAVLLEDSADPGRFVSYAPLSDPEIVSDLLSKSEFQTLWARVMRFCKEVKPHSLRVVGSVTGKTGN